MRVVLGLAILATMFVIVGVLVDRRDGSEFFGGDWNAFRAHWNMDRLANGDFAEFGSVDEMFATADYVVEVRVLSQRVQVLGIGNIDRARDVRDYREFKIYSAEVLNVHSQRNENFVINVGDVVDIIDVHSAGFGLGDEFLLYMLYILPEFENHESTLFFMINSTQAIERLW